MTARAKYESCLLVYKHSRNSFDVLVDDALHTNYYLIVSAKMTNRLFLNSLIFQKSEMSSTHCFLRTENRRIYHNTVCMSSHASTNAFKLPWVHGSIMPSHSGLLRWHKPHLCAGSCANEDTGCIHYPTHPQKSARLFFCCLFSSAGSYTNEDTECIHYATHP